MATMAAEREWGISTELTDEERANLATFESIAECWNAHDVPRILEHYNDEVVWRNIATGEVFDGKGEIGPFLQELFDAIPDLELDVTLRVPRGKYVAEEYELRGHHRGTLFGIPATGRYVVISCVSMVEMHDAKWREDRFYFDVSNVLHQMGLFPSPTVAKTRVGHLGMAFLVGLTRAGRRIRHPLGGKRAARPAA
jgi:steroid delta-isomerase-like uncharacterized protein